MQFKNPEILYFLFLLVIPIIVHLFQLRRFKKIYFSNVALLKELSQQTRKSSKIKKWLLLATRLLLLAALVFAFAQPFFSAADKNAKTNELYIVLDNSMSMQAKGKNGELLKREVENLLEQTPENKTFSLITNDRSFYMTDIKSIRSDLQNLVYSAIPFSISNSISKINARKSAFAKDIVVITDGINIGKKPSLTNGNLMYIISKAERKSNISIDSVHLEPTSSGFYNINVDISESGESINSVPVALYDKGKLVAKAVADMKSGKKTLSFNVPKNGFDGYVSIVDQGLSYDNSYYFSILKPQKTKVLAIGESTKNAFLQKLYTDDEFDFGQTSISSLDYNIIDQQQTIVLNELAEIPQALQNTLKDFVAKGGNLIVVPSAESDARNLGSFANIYGNVGFREMDKNKRLITKISFSHPIFRSVFEKKIDNFQYPMTKSSFGISSTNPAILSYDDGNPFLVSAAGNAGNAYFFAAPLNIDNSNFQNSPLIVPVFYNMALGEKANGIVDFTIGKNQSFVVDAKVGKDEILTVASDAEKFIPEQQLLSGRVKMTFADLPQKAGNFQVIQSENVIAALGFNYDRTESSNQALDLSVFADGKEMDSLESVFDAMSANRTDNELWKIFLILGLLFLTCEILIQKFVK